MWYWYHCLALLSLVVLTHTIGPPIPQPTTEKPPNLNCGYKSCHPVKPQFINVHLVPHTHDDVGWLKTVDQYYYGSNTDSQNAGVQYILDTVVDSLMKDKNRRFIYVETAFFWKWWIKQHDIVKARVRNFVKTGRLEFIGGGWSMNDEATTNYQSIIDQMTWGLRKLNDTFGECGRPKIGWQIDPFGHSKEMASIFAQLGYDAVLLGRIDYQEKRVRWTTKTPEMVWKTSDSLGESSDIFTGILYNTYGPPPGFCFDLLCDDEPFIDDRKSFEYNVDSKVDQFIEYLDNVTQVYTTNNLLITMGEDFNYQDAEVWFKNLDKLIYYVNQRQENGSKYHLIYSTPSCYVKAIHDEAGGHRWPVKNDDFFPYSSDPHAFWTGYFTSRPAVKRYERLGNNFLQICKQLYALADLGPEDRVDLNVLREAMGVMQHHDAITGTEKQHVADDYTRHLEQGFEECQLVITSAINKLLNVSSITLDNCPLVNISQCGPSEDNHQFMVTVYNPLSRPVSKVVRVPVNGTRFNVKDLEGHVYVWNIDNDLENLICDLVAHDGYVTHVTWTSDVNSPKSVFLATSSTDGLVKTWNFDLSTGCLQLKTLYKIKPPILGRINQSTEISKSVLEKGDLGVVCFDFSPHLPDVFIVGLEGGLVVRCSVLGATKTKSINDLPCFDPVFKYYEPHGGEIVAVKCCPHNKDLFLTSGTDGEVRIYLLNQDDPAQVIFTKSPLNDLSFVQHEDQLLVGCGLGGTLEIYHLVQGKSVPLTFSENVPKQVLTSLTVKGNWVAVGGQGGSVQLWAVPWRNICLQNNPL